jgi:hypothetical protein
MKRMRKTWAIVAGVLCAGAMCGAFAVDGIAVSMQTSVLWPSAAGGDIMRYDIKNNDVVSVTKLLDGGGGDANKTRMSGRFPAISFDGARIAFFRCTNDSGRYVSIMKIDGSGLHDLAKIPPQTGGYEGMGYLHWARINGVEWVYYMLAGDEFDNEGNKRLWRVNAAAPYQNQEVVVFQYAVWQFGMSADASRAILRLLSENPMGQIFKYTMPGTGAISSANKVEYGDGCGVAMSPSGMWFMRILGGSHITIQVHSWDLTKDTILQSYPDINSWAVNSSTFSTHCLWSAISGGITVSLGYGTDSNRWSCNSDKWFCLFMGWPTGDGASGRDPFCGSNQVLVNWKDHIAVNASNNPRACTMTEMDSGCDTDAGALAYRSNDAGDFFVSAPAEDVNADLRVSINRPGTGNVSPGMTIDAGGLARFSVPKRTARLSVRLFDARGGVIMRRNIGILNAAGEIPGVRSQGIYFIEVRCLDPENRTIGIIVSRLMHAGN